MGLSKPQYGRGISEVDLDNIDDDINVLDVMSNARRNILVGDEEDATDGATHDPAKDDVEEDTMEDAIEDITDAAANIAVNTATNTDDIATKKTEPEKIAENTGKNDADDGLDDYLAGFDRLARSNDRVIVLNKKLECAQHDQERVSILVDLVGGLCETNEYLYSLLVSMNNVFGK
jgi:hypothetical protein